MLGRIQQGEKKEREKKSRVEVVSYSDRGESRRKRRFSVLRPPTSKESSGECDSSEVYRTSP